MNTLIIAEAGVNHNGSVERAKQLIEVAAEAGANFVKFQTFSAEKLASRGAAMAPYQLANVQDALSQFEMLKALELSEKDHLDLLEHARLCKIGLFSTAFDEESLDFLDKLEPELYKIPSGEITNLPYLRKIARKSKPTLVSTGMATLGEIQNAVEILLNHGLRREHITVLHCTTEYPAPFDEVNLTAMQTIHAELGVKVGYSDHTMGIEVAIAAVAMGAKCIEKHFTLDRNLPGPDHKASLEPSELRAMIKAIRNVELAVNGNGIKVPSPSELPNIAVARKSIHIRTDLVAGHILREVDLTMKRPGTGISPMEMDRIIGRRLNQDLLADTMLQYSQLV